MCLPEGANGREETFTPLLHPVDCRWEALSGESMEKFKIRTDEVVSYVLNTIAPSQQEQLWEGVVKRHCSVESKINNIAIDVGLEAILLAYNECSNRLTKLRLQVEYGES